MPKMCFHFSLGAANVAQLTGPRYSIENFGLPDEPNITTSQKNPTEVFRIVIIEQPRVPTARPFLSIHD